MESSDITQEPSAPLNYTALATQTEGYSVTDLKDLVARAVHRAAIRSSQLEHDETQQVCRSFPYYVPLPSLYLRSPNLTPSLDGNRQR